MPNILMKIKAFGDISEAVEEEFQKHILKNPKSFLNRKQFPDTNIDAQWYPGDCPKGVMLIMYPQGSDYYIWRYHAYPIGPNGMAQVNSYNRYEGIISISFEAEA